MPDRQFRPRTRVSGIRDARLIIIAAEGEKTEKRYFNELANHYRNPKVHVEVLDRISASLSSPEDVIETLNTFKRTYHLGDDDELWLVIDVDRWKEKMLSEVAAQCNQKRYLLWLLLHVASMDEYTPEQIEGFFVKSRLDNRHPLEQELIAKVGKHAKSNLDCAPYLPHVQTAIERARVLDKNPADRWTQEIGTRVYLLADSILRKNKL
jgi:hypothetical protein